MPAVPCDANVSGYVSYDASKGSCDGAGSCDVLKVSNVSTVASKDSKRSKSAKAVWSGAKLLKKKAGGRAVPAMFEALATSSVTAIAKEFGLGTAAKNAEIVMISGKEWPETEWDTPGAWYPGTVVETIDGGVWVAFEDEEKPLDFTHKALETYAKKYDEFQAAKFDCLIDATELIEDARTLM